MFNTDTGDKKDMNINNGFLRFAFNAFVEALIGVFRLCYSNLCQPS